MNESKLINSKPSDQFLFSIVIFLHFTYLPATQDDPTTWLIEFHYTATAMKPSEDGLLRRFRQCMQGEATDRLNTFTTCTVMTLREICQWFVSQYIHPEEPRPRLNEMRRMTQRTAESTEDFRGRLEKEGKVVEILNWV